MTPQPHSDANSADCITDEDVLAEEVDSGRQWRGARSRLRELCRLLGRTAWEWTHLAELDRQFSGDPAFRSEVQLAEAERRKAFWFWVLVAISFVIDTAILSREISAEAVASFKVGFAYEGLARFVAQTLIGAILTALFILTPAFAFSGESERRRIAEIRRSHEGAPGARVAIARLRRKIKWNAGFRLGTLAVLGVILLILHNRFVQPKVEEAQQMIAFAEQLSAIDILGEGPAIADIPAPTMVSDGGFIYGAVLILICAALAEFFRPTKGASLEARTYRPSATPERIRTLAENARTYADQIRDLVKAEPELSRELSETDQRNIEAGRDGEAPNDISAMGAVLQKSRRHFSESGLPKAA